MTENIHPVEIRWHTGPREELRELFALAEDSEQELTSYLPLGRVLVAVADGTIVGHLQLIDAEEGLELKSLAVSETTQRRGIGRALVRRAIEAAREAGAATMLVSTATADTGNLRFYQREGFRFLRVERDAFTAAEGYPDGLTIDGIPLRDRIWLSQDL
jgi:ribosomal protein S18 acetylase RimI-like enzyme